MFGRSRQVRITADQLRGPRRLAVADLVSCIRLILIQAPSRLRRYWGYARETSKDP